MNIDLNDKLAFAILKKYPQGTTINDCVGLAVAEKVAASYKYALVKLFNDGYSASEQEIETYLDVDEALDAADERNQRGEDYVWYSVEVSR